MRPARMTRTMPGVHTVLGEAALDQLIANRLRPIGISPVVVGNASRRSPHRALSSMGKYGGIEPYTKMQVTEYQGQVAGDRLANLAELT
jgi:hypothetical protein